MLDHEFRTFVELLPSRIIAHFELLRGVRRGLPVDRYEHSLQTASRAMRDGAGDEVVVCALLHDIGDVLGPRNHAAVAAAVLRPYISTENCWMIEHHDVFRRYLYGHGRDRQLREQYRAHPAFDRTAAFAERWDHVSFDPAYDTLPISTFVPAMVGVFADRR